MVASPYEAYFDESGTDAAATVMCVAGYVMPSSQAQRMDASWRRLLQRYELPFLHMKDLAPGNGPYRHMAVDQRAALVTSAINLVKKHTSHGFAIVSAPQAHEAGSDMPDIYSFAVECCAALAGSWVRARPIPSRLAAFLESGHPRERTAASILSTMTASGTFGIVASTFAPKREVPLLQAADLLAWQSTKFVRDKVFTARKPRRDFLSLVQHPHTLMLVFVRNNTVAVAPIFEPNIDHPRRDQFIKAAFGVGEWPDDQTKPVWG